MYQSNIPALSEQFICTIQATYITIQTIYLGTTSTCTHTHTYLTIVSRTFSLRDVSSVSTSSPCSRPSQTSHPTPSHHPHFRARTALSTDRDTLIWLLRRSRDLLRPRPCFRLSADLLLLLPRPPPGDLSRFFSRVPVDPRLPVLRARLLSDFPSDFCDSESESSFRASNRFRRPFLSADPLRVREFSREIDSRETCRTSSHMLSRQDSREHELSREFLA